MCRVLIILLGLVLLFLPLLFRPSDLPPAAAITLGLFLMAGLYWMTAPVPIYATSLLVILAQLLLLSQSAPGVLLAGFPYPADEAPDAKVFTGTLAHPILILFLGGFMLAAGAVKYSLEKNLVRIFLGPCRNSPKLLLFGVMLVTALLSAFMSNTATTAMMIAIILPVLALVDEKDPLRISLALAVPIGANLGGMATPIGTPPNAVALGALASQGIRVTFAEWMMLAVPLTLIALGIAGVFLLILYPAQAKSVQLALTGRFDRSRKAIALYVVGAATVLLWATESLHQIPSTVTAFLPIALLPCLGVIDRDDIRSLSWEVLWLVAGGISLGLSLEKTGLATWMVGLIPWESLGLFGIVAGFLLVSVILANFLSHTVTTTLLVPIVISLGTSGVLPGPAQVAVVAIAVAIVSSFGMSLPISTPPNAIAIATGAVTTPQMAKIGVAMAITGSLLTYAAALYFWPMLLK